MGSRGDKGYLSSTCPHAGFYGFSIYRTVKNFIIYSELIQLCWAGYLLFLFIATVVYSWVLNFYLRTWAVLECGLQELELNPPVLLQLDAEEPHAC